MRSAVRAMLVVYGVVLGLAPPALADGPGVGTPIVVTLGDSAISGEAGRWAGNTNDSSSRVDALGSTAYWDTRRPASRSPAATARRPAQAHIGGGVNGANLACSGARTYTTGTGSGETSSPASTSTPTPPAARARRSRCSSPPPRTTSSAVDVMIGANNYGFAAIVERCVTNWLTSPSWWKNYCSDDSDMTSRFTAARQRRRPTDVKDALLRVRDGDGQRGLRRLAVHDHRPDLLDADPARHRLPLRARPAGRARRSAAAASGTATRTGRTTRSCRR